MGLTQLEVDSLRAQMRVNKLIADLLEGKIMLHASRMGGRETVFDVHAERVPEKKGD